MIFLVNLKGKPLAVQNFPLVQLGQRVLGYPRCQNHVWDLTCNLPEIRTVPYHRAPNNPLRPNVGYLIDRPFVCFVDGGSLICPRGAGGGRNFERRTINTPLCLSFYFSISFHFISKRTTTRSQRDKRASAFPPHPSWI